jgi:hypothetical protein
LGGYSAHSPALEQIGTEVDCTGRGVRSTAWFELVPAPSTPISLAVAPGDQLSASVVVTGSHVRLSLRDFTRGRRFVKTLKASATDVTSAEWIVEAPSNCLSASVCQTLPLANFGNAEFDSALAVSARWHAGGISDQDWQTTQISLVPQATRYFISQGSATSVGAALPSSLDAAGHSFQVSYSQLPVAAPSRFYARPSPVLRGGYLLHPGR